MFDNYTKKEFKFAERDAVIIYPSCEPNGKMLLKTEYLDAFPAFDEVMLDRGYYLIHIFNRLRWGFDHETKIMADFVKYCAKELGASQRCILEGMSCDGLEAAKLAELHPELVDAYGFSRTTVVNFRKSPIDNMAPLIENNIPVLLVYGNNDAVVLFEENGRVLENYYKEHGAQSR